MLSCFTLVKAHFVILSASREMTGKSMLLQKIRDANRTGNKYPAHSGLGNESEHPKTKPECPCSHELRHRSSKMEGLATTQVQLQHQNILKQLETHRPTKSVNQKQAAADKTDVLYDFVSAENQKLQDIKMTQTYLWLFVFRKYLIYSQSAHSQQVSKTRRACC